MSRERAQDILTQCLGPFGPLRFPYVTMGRIDSLHLFGLDTEMPIFAFYWLRRHRYKRALDIGANIGLHSILMHKCGWNVMAYEPDFAHYQQLLANLEANRAYNVTPCMAAVHTSTGEAHFVRVLNNLTGNHLLGYKDSYGPIEQLLVPTVNCVDLFNWAAAGEGLAFAKIDCEGNEADILTRATQAHMAKLDCIVEVRNKANAKTILDHFLDMRVPVYSQKISWGRVERLEDMPHVNREGSIYVGHRHPWT